MSRVASLPSRAPSRVASPAAPLSRTAGRLLAALAEPGSVARPDPSREGFVVVRGRAGSVSVGRGAFPAEAAAELSARDLAAPALGGGLAISPVGTAHARRRAAAADGGEPFLDQHREPARAEIADGEGGPARVAVNGAESPLDWLRRRTDRDGAPLIDAAGYEAGERLRRDLTMGALLPNVTARWDGAIGGGGAFDPAAATDATIAARQRVRRAFDALGGEFANLLLDLCGFLKGLELIERERGWPRRSGKVVVRLALGQLARHYGLGTEARGPSTPRGIRTWQAE